MEQKDKGNIYSPDSVLEHFLRTGESQTDSSKTSTSESEEAQNDANSVTPPTRFCALLRNKSRRKLASLNPLANFKLSKKFSGSISSMVKFTGSPNPLIDSSLLYFKPQWKNFPLSQLQKATSNFSRGNLIGKGGYADVYRGRLPGGRLVAVKRLTRGPLGERMLDFLSELGIMGHLNHPNTAKMVGYGIEGGLFLIMELYPRGSLASMLQSSKEKLTWDVRYKIALGAAEGLLYLHEGCQRRIIHRDIKAANLLLADDFEPQICDFGLAKWLPERWTHLTVSKFEGTFGYLAPEFLMHGIVDEKTDIFAFGVLLLELITGRRALDYSNRSLLIWAKPLLMKCKIRELVDSTLSNNYNPSQMNLMILTASLCVQESSIKRPRMRQVLLLLKGRCGDLELVRKFNKLSSWKKYYEELFSAEDLQQFV
ncbi:receptor-like cytosolic serine/threonine-protein kinase RBK2 [Primulina tabacum]|uniref:receptor-like cytosolic serine/threonine-protein kinase RBK2 n=1 Tax=Primulina tabacum TaxID=48773 RepID=UPI003F5998AD